MVFQMMSVVVDGPLQRGYGGSLVVFRIVETVTTLWSSSSKEEEVPSRGKRPISSRYMVKTPDLPAELVSDEGVVGGIGKGDVVDGGVEPHFSGGDVGEGVVVTEDGRTEDLGPGPVVVVEAQKTPPEVRGVPCVDEEGRREGRSVTGRQSGVLSTVTARRRSAIDLDGDLLV